MFTASAWESQDCILNVSVFYGPIQDFFFLCVCGALAVLGRSPACCEEVRVDGDVKRFPPPEGAFAGSHPSVCSRGGSLSKGSDLKSEHRMWKGLRRKCEQMSCKAQCHTAEPVLLIIWVSRQNPIVSVRKKVFVFFSRGGKKKSTNVKILLCKCQ